MLNIMLQRIITIVLFTFLTSMVFPSQAKAWSASYLGTDGQGNAHFVIFCSDGGLELITSSLGEIVDAGDAYCPNGIVGPGGPGYPWGPGGPGSSGPFNPNMPANFSGTVSEIEATRLLVKYKIQMNLAQVSYPPNGYPCLGCEPCPGNPEEFCDTVWSSGEVANLSSNERIARRKVVWSPRKPDDSEKILALLNSREFLEQTNPKSSSTVPKSRQVVPVGNKSSIKKNTKSKFKNKFKNKFKRRKLKGKMLKIKKPRKN